MNLIVKTENMLTRDDFDGGPISLDLIDDKLYLGNVTAACDVHTLNSLNISHILTIDSVPLPRHITDLKHLTTKYMQVTDMPKEDILSIFDVTNAFISKALEDNHTVLIHCYYGMSRSASVVIAFIMNKYNIGYEEAFQRVKSKRNIVSPNSGFVIQLKLYESMGSKLDKTHNKYKCYRLKIAADKVRKVKILPQTCLDLIQPDPALLQARPDPLVYRCRKCRRIVACQSNIITHKKKNKSPQEINYSGVRNETDSSSSSGNYNGPLINTPSGELINRQEDIHKIRNLKLVDESPNDNSKKDSSKHESCNQTYFVEPIAWMKDITHNTEGKLYCPHCKNKLGSFSWLMGCQCPCGTKLSPAFYLVPSKVEWSNIVQNIESTL